MKSTNLSFIIPIYNEENILKRNLKIIANYLNSLEFINNFEIIVVNNGSTDSSQKILFESIKSIPEIRQKYISERNLGKAIKIGLTKSRYNAIMLMSIDTSFGLGIIKRSVNEYLNKADIVLGSKGHPKSVYKAPFKRVAFSKFYNFLVRHLFKIKVKDTQGTLVINKKLVDLYVNELVPNGAWIQTQIVIYGCALGAKVIELPVMYNAGSRKSKIKISDTITTLKDLFHGYIKYLKWLKTSRDINF